MKADCKDHAKKYLAHVITACSKIFVYTVTKDTGKSLASIYLFNIYNENTRVKCEICSIVF